MYPTEAQRTLPSRAALKRKAAAKREHEAVRLRQEAAECDRQWAEFKAAREAQRQAAKNVARAAAS